MNDTPKPFQKRLRDNFGDRLTVNAGLDVVELTVTDSTPATPNVAGAVLNPYNARKLAKALRRAADAAEGKDLKPAAPAAPAAPAPPTPPARPQVGDRVQHPERGPGTVTAVYKSADFPYLIRYDKGASTSGGSDEVTPLAAPTPAGEPQVGDRVRIVEAEWWLGIVGQEGVLTSIDFMVTFEGSGRAYSAAKVEVIP